MFVKCVKCDEYKSKQIGFRLGREEGHVVCDECFDICMKEMYAARAKFQEEFEREYIPNFLAEKSREADERMINDMLRDDFEQHNDESE